MKIRKPHIIDLQALLDWKNENESLFATDGNKRLTASMNGGFKLYYNKQVIWEGIQPFTAVDKYNELP